MNKDETNAAESVEPNHELRLEYDLSQLQVRRLGSGWRQFSSDVVRLAPDVAAVFQDAEAVNEALRLLIKVARSSGQPQPKV
jgi:hypothetical protein